MIAAQLDTILIGATCYARIVSPTNLAQVWDTNAEAFANRSGVTAANMAVSGTVDASGFFTASEPTGFPAGLIADCTLHERPGGSPAVTDPYVGAATTNMASVAVFTTTEQGRLDVAISSRSSQSIADTISSSVDEIKTNTDQLDFSGAGDALKSESTNMRGTDNALLSSSYTAAPSAAATADAVRSELTDELARIDEPISTRSSALDVQGLEITVNTISNNVGTIGANIDNAHSKLDALSDQTQTIEDAVSDLEAGGTIVPVNQVPVPLTRTWILKQTDDGLVGELPLTRTVGEEQLFACDFRSDLPNNGRLIAIESITWTGTENGIDISEVDRGVDRSVAKFKIEALLVGTYEITIEAAYDDSDGGGTSIGIVTLIVK